MPRVRTKSGKVKKYPYTKAGMKKAKAANSTNSLLYESCSGVSAFSSVYV